MKRNTLKLKACLALLPTDLEAKVCLCGAAGDSSHVKKYKRHVWIYFCYGYTNIFSSSYADWVQKKCFSLLNTLYLWFSEFSSAKFSKQKMFSIIITAKVALGIRKSVVNL